MIRAIGPVAGALWSLDKSKCQGPMAAFMAHGTNDPQLPFAQGMAARDYWIAASGCSPKDLGTLQRVLPARRRPRVGAAPHRRVVSGLR